MNVFKTPEQWARFQQRTNNGANKRPGFRPVKAHRPVKRGK